MAKVTKLSGFPEWLPDGRIAELTVLDTARRIFELHGFASIETRSVEPLEQMLPLTLQKLLCKTITAVAISKPNVRV